MAELRERMIRAEEQLASQCERLDGQSETLTLLQQAQQDLKVEVRVLVAKVSVWAALGGCVGGGVVAGLAKALFAG